ncbi:MAG: RraA family protein [Geminicoccaceae bacterium]|nr:MAG: RraA family protein [Geminicoccaceae bacterium]
MTDPLLDQLAQLQTSTLANALDDIDFDGVMLGLLPAAPGMKLVGRAVTVRETTGPKGSFPVEDFKVGHMIDAAGPGEVIVVANGGAPVSTWGGMASWAAKLKGISGLVCDGGCRDREEIAQFGFPLFSRHMVPTPGKTRLKVEAIGEPIVCAGVRVRPGDLIVADGTGVVCIPQEHAEAVAAAAARYAADDELAMRELEQGLTFTEALRKFRKI